MCLAFRLGMILLVIAAAHAAEPAAVAAHAALPEVQPDFPAQRASVADAAGQLRLREAPPPFDAQAYARNPAAYLAAVHPHRVEQPARAGLGVPTIRTLGEPSPTLASGATAILRVATGVPRAPVSFTAQDGGAFPNGLGFVTVVADAEGVAEAAYTATPDVVAIAQVLVASPVTQGQARFALRITEPAAQP